MGALKSVRRAGAVETLKKRNGPSTRPRSSFGGHTIRESSRSTMYSWIWWTKYAVPLVSVPGWTVDAVSFTQRNGEVLDSATRKVGFRRIELVRAPLSDGEDGHTFVFLLNNVPLFLGGSNWIPIDSFLTNGSPPRYRRLLEMARDGNQTMVRVWGGGVYEAEIFYETCVSSSAWVSKETAKLHAYEHEVDRTSWVFSSGKTSCLHAPPTPLSSTIFGTMSRKKRSSKSKGFGVTPASPYLPVTTKTSQSSSHVSLRQSVS
jgi:hypothetical protein